MFYSSSLFTLSSESRITLRRLCRLLLSLLLMPTCCDCVVAALVAVVVIAVFDAIVVNKRRLSFVQCQVKTDRLLLAIKCPREK